MKLDLARLVEGLPQAWTMFLTDWDRSLRSGNYPPTTRYNYLLTAAQLARYLASQACELDAGQAVATPVAVGRGDGGAVQAGQIGTPAPAAAVDKRKAPPQVFKWLVLDKEEIDPPPKARG